jgi:nitroreductase
VSKPVDPTLLEGLATTRAIRRYTDEPVPDEALARMIFAATRAPSGSNRQGFRFLVLRAGDPHADAARGILGEAMRSLWGRKRGAEGYDRGSGARADSPKARLDRTMQHYADHLEDAPVVVLACMVRHRPPPEELVGASIYPACQNLLLAARALGYGGVLTTIQGMVEPQLRAALGIPDDVFLAATITIGRPAGGHGSVRRRPISEVTYESEWGRPAPWAVDPPGTRFTSAGPPRAAPASPADTPTVAGDDVTDSRGA